jgi:hypothetical protein
LLPSSIEPGTLVHRVEADLDTDRREPQDCAAFDHFVGPAICRSREEVNAPHVLLNDRVLLNWLIG